MTLYFFVLQYLHVIGATVLLGTGRALHSSWCARIGVATRS